MANNAKNSTAWTPLMRVDLASVSREAFGEVMPKLLEHGKALQEAGTLPPSPFDKDGWYDVTPQMAEAALFHSGGNREIVLRRVRDYAMDMAANDWQPNGEPICVKQGKPDDGYHRLLASYLGQHTFRTYVVASVPPIVNSFAYYDCGKTRTGADALHIAGWNSMGRTLNEVIKNLALRYDENKLGVGKQPRFREPNSRDILNYLEAHRDLREAAQTMLGSFPEAIEVVRSKPAAIMFAWLVMRAHDLATLQGFCQPLGSGALLAEDSPILAVRAKLMEAEDCNSRKPARMRLAYLCKAFQMHVTGQKMPRSRKGAVQPLSLNVDEPFPRIDPPVPFSEAAE